VPAPSRHRLIVWAAWLLLGCAGERSEHDGEPARALTGVRAPAPAPLSPIAPSSTTALAARAPKSPAPASSAPASSAHADPTETRCREQPAQVFLTRRGQIAKIGAPAAERRGIEAARKRAIDYRTRHYGRFPGVGSRRDNPHPPQFYAKRAKFMGLPVVLHEKIVPALACVEARLLRECGNHPYRPRRIGGLRLDNTFLDYEVSNHVYGIALDIDSDLNPCCNCIGNWSKNAACAKKVSSVFERMAMPPCWVEVFERYGFHWLGRDDLEDTMHFEFLGDPELILAPG
jgi:hypothetical protein